MTHIHSHLDYGGGETQIEVWFWRCSEEKSGCVRCVLGWGRNPLLLSPSNPFQSRLLHQDHGQHQGQLTTHCRQADIFGCANIAKLKKNGPIMNNWLVQLCVAAMLTDKQCTKKKKKSQLVHSKVGWLCLCHCAEINLNRHSLMTNRFRV